MHKGTRYSAFTVQRVCMLADLCADHRQQTAAIWCLFCLCIHFFLNVWLPTEVFDSKNSCWRVKEKSDLCSEPLLFNNRRLKYCLNPQLEKRKPGQNKVINVWVLGHLWDPEAMEVNFVELNRQTVFGQPVACFVRTSNINELTTKNKMVNWNKSILPLGCNTPHDSVSAATTQPPHTSYISCMTMHSSCCISACRDINSLMHISGGSLRFSGFKLLNRVISWFWQAPNKAHRSWSAGKQGSIYQTPHPIRAYKPIIKLFFLNSGLQDCK